MNQKMIEAALGMVARFIPPEEYAKAVAAINDLTALVATVDARIQRIEALVQRVEMLESVVRNNVSGAATSFAERDMYMIPGTIEAALAPAQRKDTANG